MRALASGECCALDACQGEAEAGRNRFAELTGCLGPVTADDGVVLGDAVEDGEVRPHKRIWPGEFCPLSEAAIGSSAAGRE
jgi:hypothetical protein